MKDFSLRPPQQTSSKFSLAYLGLVMVGMGIGAGGTFVLTNPQLLNRLADNPAVAPLITPEVTSTQESRQSFLMPREPSNFVVDVVQETGPAVVRINAAKTVKTQTPPALNDRFFGSQMPVQPDERVERGTGSGFIVSDDGQIFTNAHVVAGADQVSVTLKDGRTFAGKVLGSDPLTDVAVVKIEADNLPVVQLGDSDQLQVGEWAIAIGNPLGLDNTVTTGILSATGRRSAEIGVPDKRVDFIQTDAAINPGNSGGPLLNAQGEVIGINTAIRADANGIGFAIPIDQAKALKNTLIAGEKVPHPYIGVQMINLTADLARQNNRNPNSPFIVAEVDGILVMRVLPDTPAERAGIRRGDVIVAVDDRPITDGAKLQAMVEKAGLNRPLKLGIIRGDRRLTLTVQTAQLQSPNS